MKYQGFPGPRLWTFALLVSVLIVAVACGGAAESTTSAPAAAQATSAPAAQTTSAPAQTGGGSSGETPAATPQPTAAPDMAAMAGPKGAFTFGLPLVPPFHVFPTVTEGAGYHHNGFTTGETLLYMNEQKEIIPRLIKEWSVADDATTWTFKRR